MRLDRFEFKVDMDSYKENNKSNVKDIQFGGGVKQRLATQPRPFDFSIDVTCTNTKEHAMEIVDFLESHSLYAFEFKSPTKGWVRVRLSTDGYSVSPLAKNVYKVSFKMESI